MPRSAQHGRQEGRYPALLAVINRRRQVFGLCDRELAERTQSRFGTAKNVSQVYRILRGDSGTRQGYAEQLAHVVDIGRHICRLLIEFEDDLLPLEFGDGPPTDEEANEVIDAYDRDEDMYALQGAVRLYERSMGKTCADSLRIRADMSLVIGKLVRLHGKHPGFIDDALRFVDDAVNLYIGMAELPGAPAGKIEASLLAAELERATIYRRRGHLEMALRTLEACRARFATILAGERWLDGKCWHGMGDLFEQKSLIHHGTKDGERYAHRARSSYEQALVAYEQTEGHKTHVDRLAIVTDLAMLEIRAGEYDAANARLDELEKADSLPPTVLARMHNRRAWVCLALGEAHRTQRYVKLAARAASDAGDPLLMSMAEVLKYQFYRSLNMQKKASMQYEHVLDWVYRDGIRHAEVLQPLAAATRDAGQPAETERLAWLLRVPWLNAMLGLLLVLGTGMMGGCVADESAGDSGDEAGLGIPVVVLDYNIHAGDVRPEGSDPKQPQSSDPKEPVSSDPKGPASSDPKNPLNSDPKKPSASDPKNPEGSDPKNPEGSDPKKKKCPGTNPTNSDPKDPEGSDPKKPDGSDPKNPEGSDPKNPEGSDPKSPASSDPKKPSDSDPKEPTDADETTECTEEADAEDEAHHA